MKKWSWTLVSVAIAVLVLNAIGYVQWSVQQTEKARRIQTESTLYNLKIAIEAFHTEYQEYPLFDPATDLTIDSKHALMNILLSSEKEKVPIKRNPRGIQFYADRAAKPTAEGRFRNGISFDEDGGGELWDPWGKNYRIQLDTNDDSRIDNPEATGTYVPESILIWSAGKDGDFETWDDNVKTW